MPLEHQVVAIFAGNEGLLDDIPVEKIKDFEKGLLDFIDKNCLDIFHEISRKNYFRDIERKMKDAILKFKILFNRGTGTENARVFCSRLRENRRPITHD